MCTNRKNNHLLLLSIFLLCSINSNAQEQKSFYQMMKESDVKIEDYSIDYSKRKLKIMRKKAFCFRAPWRKPVRKYSNKICDVSEGVEHLRYITQNDFHFNPIADTILMVVSDDYLPYRGILKNYQGDLAFLGSSIEYVSWFDDKFYPVRKEKVNRFVFSLRTGKIDAFLEDFCGNDYSVLDLWYDYYIIPISNNTIQEPVFRLSGTQNYLDGFFTPDWLYIQD